MQAIDRLGGHGDRGVEAEGVVGRGQIVVDGLRHGDDRNAHVAQPLSDAESAVAADGDEAVDLQFADVTDDLAGAVDAIAATVGILERIAAVGRPQQRAAFRKDAANGLSSQGDDGLRQQPFEAELNAEDVKVVIAGGADRGANDGVEARAVAAAGQNSDSLFVHHT